MATLRRQDEADRDIALAWHIVAIDAKARHDKRLPRLETLLSRETAVARPQSVASMRQAMLLFAEAHNAALKH